MGKLITGLQTNLFYDFIGPVCISLVVLLGQLIERQKCYDQLVQYLVLYGVDYLAQWND